MALYDPVKQLVESFDNPVKELAEKEYSGDPKLTGEEETQRGTVSE